MFKFPVRNSAKYRYVKCRPLQMYCWHKWELGSTVKGTAIDGMRSSIKGILTARGEEDTQNCAVVPVHNLTTSVAVMLSVSVEYCLVFIASLRTVLWHCRPTNSDALWTYRFVTCICSSQWRAASSDWSSYCVYRPCVMVVHRWWPVSSL